MRPFYPISSIEMKNELNEIQEHLISLIGYDANPHDNYVDKQGTYDTIEESIDASGVVMMRDRLFSEGDDPLYKQVYYRNFIYNVRRGSNG